METIPVLLHLTSFVLALGIGFHHLATGRGTRGLWVVAGAFALLDVALVRGFVYQIQDLWTSAALAALHLLAVWELVAVLRRGWGRQRPAWRKRRLLLLAEAGAHYAAGRFVEALGPLVLAGRVDPWDPAPLVWQGYCRLHQGQARRARSVFARARALDRRGEWELALRRGLASVAAVERRPKRPARAGG